MSEKKHIKIIAENRKARHDYHIDEEFEAGMALKGTEVKSLRLGQANLKDSYARIKNGEVFVHQMHINPYPFAYYDNHDPLRPRKLLLHKAEIAKIQTKLDQRGFTVVPLRIYFNDRGLAKVQVALARGKRQYDKRKTIAERDQKRNLDRAMKKFR